MEPLKNVIGTLLVIPDHTDFFCSHTAKNPPT